MRGESTHRVGASSDMGPEDDSGESVQATVGSQNSAIQPRSPSRNRGTRNRPVTRQLARRTQSHQRQHDQDITDIDDILKWDDESQFRGLTPPPWPTELTPNRKRPRTVEEVIEDDAPRAKDKLSEELERLQSDLNNPQDKKKLRLSVRPKRLEPGPSSSEMADRRDGGLRQGDPGQRTGGNS